MPERAASHRTASLSARVAQDGFAIVPEGISAASQENLLSAIEELTVETSGSEVRRRRASTYAVRNLLALSPEVRALATSPELLALVQPVLGPEARAVRATLFDKAPGANWNLAYHQDLTIAVRERRDVPGWDRWSVKSGVPHVQPPAEVLEGMLAVRVHLDDCDLDNGALRVLPGSHRFGRLSDDAMDEIQRVSPETTCELPAGGVLLMHPLLLHASSHSRSDRHRRVIHYEYSAAKLPGGLEWWG